MIASLLVWELLHDGFPGMGKVAHTRDGSYFTIRPSSIFKGHWDLRWWRADLQTVQFMGCMAHGSAVLHAGRAYITYTLSERRADLRDEIQAQGSC